MRYPFISVACVLFWNCALRAESENSIVGKIGDLEISAQEIKSALGDAPGSSDPAMANQWVRSLLVQKFLLKEALAKKWEQRPEVKLQLERIRETSITESYLQSLCAPDKSYPSEAEVKQAYEANRESLRVPRQFRLGQIFIASPTDSDKAQLENATAKLDLVKQKLGVKAADFAAIAKEHSEEVQSASRGGEIGWLTEAQIQPEIRSLLPKLELNVISDPVKLDDGWHIIRVMDTKEANTPTLEQIRPQLVQQLRTEKAKANSQEFLARILKENPLAINELALSKLIQKAEK